MHKHTYLFQRLIEPMSGNQINDRSCIVQYETCLKICFVVLLLINDATSNDYIHIHSFKIVAHKYYEESFFFHGQKYTF